MHIEYFMLIDRILDLKLDEKTITVEATVPTQSTIFEGHFPGYPIMPGVLLIDSMAQTSGWLLLGLMNFERMPFLAAVKEAKMRGFVSPGELLRVEASLLPDGSGYAITQARVSVGGQLITARLGPKARPKPGDTLTLSVDTAASNLFDPTTGNRI